MHRSSKPSRSFQCVRGRSMLRHVAKTQKTCSFKLGVTYSVKNDNRVKANLIFSPKSSALHRQNDTEASFYGRRLSIESRLEV